MSVRKDMISHIDPEDNVEQEIKEESHSDVKASFETKTGANGFPLVVHRRSRPVQHDKKIAVLCAGSGLKDI